MGSTTTYPRDLNQPAALAAVEAWLARQPWSPGLTWCAFADPDGAIGLVPGGPDGAACLALLLIEQAGGYGVTACDPDDPVELGVFASIESALHRIRCWMVPASAGTARAEAA
jgi:hypothetical protein